MLEIIAGGWPGVTCPGDVRDSVRRKCNVILEEYIGQLMMCTATVVTFE